jgi:replicative DNA helicase
MGFKTIPFKLPETIVEEAIRELEGERSDKQLGLFSRWSSMNIAINKYFRFGKVVLLAGLSGSGKSFILNMLRADFASNEDIVLIKPRLTVDPTKEGLYLGNFETKVPVIYDVENAKFRYDENSTEFYFPDSCLFLTEEDNVLIRGLNKNAPPTIILHFGFEMKGFDEYLRTASTIYGKGTDYLLSSQYNRTERKYNKISDEEVSDITIILKALKKRKELYFESSGNTKEIYETVAKLKDAYPHLNFVITIDHTMLTKKMTEKSEMELQKSVADLAVQLRQDFNALVVLVGQLNQNIEEKERKSNPQLHYPNKADIHLGSQIFWACDNVIIFHKPAKLRIEVYGKEKLNTHGLIHGALIKARSGEVDDIYFLENFVNGRLIEKKKDFFKTN